MEVKIFRLSALIKLEHLERKRQNSLQVLQVVLLVKSLLKIQLLAEGTLSPKKLKRQKVKRAEFSKELIKLHLSLNKPPPLQTHQPKIVNKKLLQVDHQRELLVKKTVVLDSGVQIQVLPKVALQAEMWDVGEPAERNENVKIIEFLEYY